MPEDSQATSYDDIELQVKEHFEGDWEKFLRAVQNPADILEFVLAGHCGGDEAAFESWFQDKKLPPDWMPRFRIAQVNAQLQGGPVEPEG